MRGYPKDNTTSYEEQYYKLLEATKKAVAILIEAQEECEDICINKNYDGDDKKYIVPSKLSFCGGNSDKS